MNRLPLPTPSCRSVFRKSETPLTAERYTKIWIQLINQMERSSSIAAGLQKQPQKRSPDEHCQGAAFFIGAMSNVQSRNLLPSVGRRPE